MQTNTNIYKTYATLLRSNASPIPQIGTFVRHQNCVRTDKLAQSAHDIRVVVERDTVRRDHFVLCAKPLGQEAASKQDVRYCTHANKHSSARPVGQKRLQCSCNRNQVLFPVDVKALVGTVKYTCNRWASKIPTVVRKAQASQTYPCRSHARQAVPCTDLESCLQLITRTNRISQSIVETKQKEALSLTLVVF